MATRNPMKIITTCNILIFILSTLCFGLTRAADSPPEGGTQRWAQPLKNAVITGTLENLQGGNGQFTAIFLEQRSDTPRGGVILLHDQGTHPDWPELIHPLRTALPDVGWSTLSLQLPVLPRGATTKEYAPLFGDAAQRIKAGVEFLQAKGVDPIILAGHGLGASMGAHMLASDPDPRIRAFIGISMSSSTEEPALDLSQSLGKITIPVLDLYGSREPEAALRAAQRMRAARGNPVTTTDAGKPKPDYRTMEITGADHLFSGQEEIMVKRIRGWLKRVTAGKINSR